MTVTGCDQELCPNWSGDGNVCPCAIFDLKPETNDDATADDDEQPADVLHVGLLSFQMDFGTLRIFRDHHGERLDCGSFYMLPEEFGALGAWLASHAEAGER